MGTRSLTIFHDERGSEIAVLYRHYDGYPSGHGADLKALLAPTPTAEDGDDPPEFKHNGMGCLAASVVAHFKKKAGDFYLHRAGTRNIGEEFEYQLSYKDNAIIHLHCAKVEGGGVARTSKLIFNGPIAEFPFDQTQTT